MGKGSSRRNEDADKIRDNWDAIFGKKKEDKPSEDKPQESDEQEHAK